MAVEIKSIDVENDAEEEYINIFLKFGWSLKSSQRVYNQDTQPLVSYKSGDIITHYSQTNTVDFTKLVFERDKNIPNYSELVDLEEDFWHYLEVIMRGRPILPPHAATMEGWAEIAEPDLRPKEERSGIHIRYGIAMAVAFVGINVLLTVMFLAGIFSVADLVPTVGAFAAIIIGIMWRVKCKSSRKKALKKALMPKESVYRTELQKIYDEVVYAAELYDYAVKRIDEIEIEAEKLL